MLFTRDIHAFVPAKNQESTSNQATTTEEPGGNTTQIEKTTKCYSLSRSIHSFIHVVPAKNQESFRF